MQRLALNLFFASVIGLGGVYLVNPAPLAAGDASIQATCGDCEGECCGYDDNGRCWASDNCDPVKPN